MLTMLLLLQAPLLIGCDVEKMSDDTLRILTNDEVISISQDPLGKSGHRVKQVNSTEVWAGPLANGDVAVVLLNTGDSTATITASWSDIGWQNDQKATVRDLWAHNYLPDTKTGSVSASVASHAVVMYRISPEKN